MPRLAGEQIRIIIELWHMCRILRGKSGKLDHWIGRIRKSRSPYFAGRPHEGRVWSRHSGIGCPVSIGSIVHARSGEGRRAFQADREPVTANETDDSPHLLVYCRLSQKVTDMPGG